MPLKLLTPLALAFLAFLPARAPSRPVVAAGLDDVVLEPAPIDPDWILDGNPVARSGLHSRAADDLAETRVWECTAGSFRWQFVWEETVLILSGSVHVTAEDGSERVLSAGDVCYFEGGTSAVWTIPDHVRKIAFCRRKMPGPIALAVRLKRGAGG
ncbi:cupin domain-containing protein [Chthonobacter albigriseus]|uniref:cupin domain-containing protein n=1 Tax=Chthonobacter albigriseus TaxID=1683161 RepID=UPI0015EFB508|nr:cupin domain-containing protein [Chthonobacter albigriseus]